MTFFCQDYSFYNVRFAKNNYEKGLSILPRIDNNNSNVFWKQFGFQKGLSCSDAISKLLEYICSAINEKKFVISVLLDLKKAYDTVNHEILLNS